MYTVLVVDDCQFTRFMYVDALSSAGFFVVEAENGFIGLNLAQKLAFDIVLTDQNMPHMDGTTLTRELRNLFHYINTPILVLTSESSDEFKMDIGLAGATGWLEKPVNSERLIAVMNLAISKHQKVMRRTENYYQ